MRVRAAPRGLPLNLALTRNPTRALTPNPTLTLTLTLNLTLTPALALTLTLRSIKARATAAIAAADRAVVSTSSWSRVPDLVSTSQPDSVSRYHTPTNGAHGPHIRYCHVIVIERGDSVGHGGGESVPC